MPHSSLRSKIKGLRYKGIITDKDCDRLCKALDNEGVLEKIKDEIIEQFASSNCAEESGCLDQLLEIIDKYKGGQE
jgi:hypothetical protein